jgi:uncharacterized protein YyaL (SSP411 family)
LFAEVYGVTADGNFEGHTILSRLLSIGLRDAETESRLASMRKKLLERRASRARPGFDDKVLADWNGLMIAALAKAAEAFVQPDWLAAANAAFDFVRLRMNKDGRLSHSYRAGEAKAPATANDYANMIKAALALANVVPKRHYIDQARAWAEVLDRHFWSEDLGGYYFAADDTSDIIVRPFSGHDEATPNANAVMASNLMMLYFWTGEERYRARAATILQSFAGAMAQNPIAHNGMLAAAFDLQAPALVVLIVPEGTDAVAFRRALNDVSLPGAVVREVREGESLPSSSPAYGKTPISGNATAYVCIGPQCSLPVTEAAALVETIRSARQATLT